MNKRRTIIIDDEKDAIDNLSILLQEFCKEIQVVSTFTDPIATLKWLKENEDPEVIFIDVQMPKITGFEFLELIDNKKMKIIFVTAHEEYALKAIDFHPFAYLLKPIDIDKLNTIYKLILASEKEINSTPVDQNIKIPTSTGFRFIRIEDVLYISADRSYCQIILHNSERITVSKSLGKFMKDIHDATLFRCHKSFVINLTKVKEFVHREGGMVILENNKEVSVSKDLRNELLHKLMGYR